MRDFYDHLIVGGGIAGVTAAESARLHAPRATVCVLGAEHHPLYSRVLLPHVADRRAAASRAILKTPDALAAKGIEYVTGAEVLDVDIHEKIVTCSDGARIKFGSLLVATGSNARRFAGPGGEHCMTFRTLDDLEPFEVAASSGAAVVYGGGFNAIDLAASFARRGARVTAVMRGDGHLARVMDAASRSMIREALAAHGVDVRPRTDVIAVEKNGNQFKAYLSDNSAILCGGVAVSIGVDPNVDFLRGSGVEIRAGVIVDAQLRAAPGIFAAGDVAEYLDVHLGGHRIAGNWQNAMFQGKVAGANMAGASSTFDMVTSYSIPCFDLPVSVVGAIDVADAERIVRHSPGAGVLQLIMKSGRVVGATCVGPFAARAAVTKLIAEEVVLTDGMRRAAGDPTADLSALIP